MKKRESNNHLYALQQHHSRKMSAFMLLMVKREKETQRYSKRKNTERAREREDCMRVYEFAVVDFFF